MKPYPKIIFVARKEAGTKDEYFHLDTDTRNLLDAQEKTLIGKYALVETLEAESKIVITVHK